MGCEVYKWVTMNNVFSQISFHLLSRPAPPAWTTIIMTPCNTYFLTRAPSIIHRFCSFYERGDYIVKLYCGQNKKVFLHSFSSAVTKGPKRPGNVTHGNTRCKKRNESMNSRTVSANLRRSPVASSNGSGDLWPLAQKETLLFTGSEGATHE